MPEELTLRVHGIEKKWAYRGRIRINPKVMQQMGLKTGDIVKITGKKTTSAIVIPISQDLRENVIQMDGLIRDNAGCQIGDPVKIERISVSPAQKIVLAPTEEGIKIYSSPDLLRNTLMNRPVKNGDVISVLGENRSAMSGMGMLFGRPRAASPTLGEIRLVVVNTNPSGIVQVKDRTRIEISSDVAPTAKGLPLVTYEDIGGLDDAIQRIREMVELPAKFPELFSTLGIDPPKGILLHGPPGCGKTLLAKAVANESEANFITLNGPEIMSKFYGQSEERLREIFREAEEKAPSIIFIDEIDSIAPKREEVTGEVERRVVAQLLALMDGMKGRGSVIVIGATNRPNALDPALRRPGRFDREIEIGIPDKRGRREILQIHTRGMPLAEDIDLEETANHLHGFVGADIAALTREAAMNTLRKVLPEINLEEKTISDEILRRLMVLKEDFQQATQMIEPSAMREVQLEIPEVKWDDIGGLKKVKQKLIEAVEWPLKFPELFEKVGIRPPRGLFLFGSPGCGKTLLAKAVATESEANFISLKGPEIFSKWVGESEKAIREIFRKARQSAPTIIYFDELDALAPPRGSHQGSQVYESVLNQLLTEMDGLEDSRNIAIIASTNIEDRIEPALLRPGRFDLLLWIPAPDLESRLEILKIHTRNMPLADDVDLKSIGDKTEYYSGADLENLCREAGMIVLRKATESLLINLEDPNWIKELKIEIQQKHFDLAFKEVVPTITSKLEQHHKDFPNRLAGKLMGRGESDRYIS
ncbi:MAG: CDC48 family AAA ATPase [Candidatus Helarchaeota archaeon]|nr:CDC48 family AAA ATPase [Candidatus Helarchaeota archaeon]